MKFIPTDLSGVIIVEPDVFHDERGFFFENYQQQKFSEGGISVSFVQDNHSRSLKGTLRGLHLQVGRPQAKLVRAIKGEIFDVAVDLRAGSPTYKKWIGVSLSDKNFRQLFVPAGFAHGFLTISDVAEVEYKCSDFYAKSEEAGLMWNDPDLGISWPNNSPVLSAKDQSHPSLSALADRLSRAPAFRI